MIRVDQAPIVLSVVLAPSCVALPAFGITRSRDAISFMCWSVITLNNSITLGRVGKLLEKKYFCRDSGKNWQKIGKNGKKTVKNHLKSEK